LKRWTEGILNVYEFKCMIMLAEMVEREKGLPIEGVIASEGSIQRWVRVDSY
jgi:hypothetical protein